ncbi:sterol desaturase/sphingolipid hydroxylase (fatty acid hydroxylase superfamily) [Nocardiopsis terrae]|uniref:Sterol desaturase/sphingolipid hydroxylase (Fatty acid hydroxylase superfamily) n=1 Tax=Nocardiopsis terrae TaxID=372655 RepID=A0ABR9HA26_9ACTN|nr:hypothetical protein [Nocardiopsis terrae]MBE1455887.1 sterol desaturase/sphingolipid hydroxylase (fatty acid hydroxylase superfamily) [Nocardiopsis terrae]
MERVRRGRLKGTLGSHDRPASALGFRLVLALFGALVLLLGTVAAVLWADEIWLAVVLGLGFVASCVNVYWVNRRLHAERPGR